MELWILAGIIVVCGIFLNKELCVRILLRILVGGTGIVLLNLCLGMWGIPSYVGLNGLTVGVCGVLGIPGFLALYGLSFYQLI